MRGGFLWSVASGSGLFNRLRLFNRLDARRAVIGWRSLAAWGRFLTGGRGFCGSVLRDGSLPSLFASGFSLCFFFRFR